jgi:hypothetical protein
LRLAARRKWPDLDLIVAALLGLALAILLFGQGGQDDTYITYWPARTLAEHGEIVNYNGIRLEQSSSLSLVVLLALLFELMPLSMPSVGYLTSLAGAACAGLLAVRLARRMGLGSRLGILSAIATAPSFGYWATSGMETPWVAFSALWFIDELTAPPPGKRSDWARLGTAALLFAGIRPEAPLLLGGLCVVFVALTSFRHRTGEGDVLSLSASLQRASVGLLAIFFVFAFRKLYFDAWWPNPALIKAGGFNLREGTQYLWDVSLQAGFFPLLFFGAGAVLVMTRIPRRGSDVAALVTALGLAQLSFLVASGGDWMTGARFLAPIVPALVLTGFVALEAVARSPRIRSGLALAYCVLNLGCSLRLLHLGLSEGQPLWTMRGVIERVEKRIGPSLVARVELLNKIHRRDAVTLSELLPIADAVVAHVPARRIQVMTGQAGMLAYHLAARHPGRVNILDLWSLTDRQLLDCFPPGSIDSSQWGTGIGTYRPLVEHEQLEARCGLPLPDIFYNEGLEAHLPKLFQQLGYELIYHQVGRIENSRGGFFHASYPAFGFIAVKRELAEAIGLKKKPTWRWSLDPR